MKRSKILMLGVLLFAAPVRAQWLSVVHQQPGFDQVTAGDFLPPDAHIAVSPAWVVHVVNSRLQVSPRFDQPVFDTALQSILGCGGTVADPRVLYDTETDRFFLIGINKNVHAWCLAVTSSNNPTLGWIRYRFPTEPEAIPGASPPVLAGTFPDYPGLSVSPDNIVLTGNLGVITGFGGELARVRQSAMAIINKDDVVNGREARWQYVKPLPEGGKPGPLYLLQPCRNGDNRPLEWAAGIDSYKEKVKEVALWRVFGRPGDPLRPVTVSTQTVRLPRGRRIHLPPNARQPGTALRVNTNDHRVLSVHCEYTTVTVALHHGCTPAGDSNRRSCLRFLNLTPDFATPPSRTPGYPVIARDVRVATAGEYYYYPAHIVDPWFNLVSVFNKSSVSQFASIYSLGIRDIFDGLDGNDQYSTPLLLRAGNIAYVPVVPPRWGDYSGIDIDRVDPQLKWVAAEYPGPATVDTWSTQITVLSNPTHP